jgi:hypothetical protein
MNSSLFRSDVLVSTTIFDSGDLKLPRKAIEENQPVYPILVEVITRVSEEARIVRLAGRLTDRLADGDHCVQQDPERD